MLFVPLVGAEGWGEDRRTPRGSRPAPPKRPSSLPEQIACATEPLPVIEDEAFATAFDRFADEPVVLLGETSHSTSEF